MNIVQVAGEEIDLRRGIDYTGVSAGAVVHDGNGKVLLMKRGEKARDERGAWDNCFGSIEFGEEIEDAVRRELKEELGVEPLELKFSHVYSLVRENPDGTTSHWVTLVHFAKVDPSKVKIGEPHKIAEIGWFTKDSLPEPLHSVFWKTAQPAIDAGILR